MVSLILTNLFVPSAHAASSMSLSCPTGPEFIGHSFTVNPQFNSDSNDIDTVSMHDMTYTTARNDVTAYSVISVLSGQQELPANGYDNSGATGTCTIEIAKGLTAADYTNTSSESFATVTFRPDHTGGTCNSTNGLLTCTSDLTIQYDGTPTYSGLFDGGTNELDGATGCSIPLQEDSTNPAWASCDPASSDTGVAVNSDVDCNLTDAQTNVYLTGTTMRVQDSYNDVTYVNTGGTNYSTSAISNGYTITANPTENFPYASTITVSGTGQDNAYDNGATAVWAPNTGTLAAFTFTTEDDNDAPSLHTLVPARSGSGSVSTNIVFNVQDLASPGSYPGLGVDISSLSVQVSASGWGPATYTSSSSEMTVTPVLTNTPYGNVYDYNISINPATNFAQNTTVTVAVEVDDLHSSANHLSDSYTFSTTDTTGPYCDTFDPTANYAGVHNDEDITFHCRDAGVGVDIDSISVLLDGTRYTRVSSPAFSYSGDSSDYLITIDPSSDFDDDYAFEIVIDIEDISNNSAEESYGLATGGESCEECEECEECTACVTPTPEVCEPETIEVERVIDECEELEEPEECVVEECEVIEGCGGELAIDPGSDEIAFLLQVNNEDYDLSLGEVEVYKSYIVISGTATPNSHLVFVVESDPTVFTTDSDSNGNWQVYMSNMIPEGHHAIYGAVSPGNGIISDQELLAEINVVDAVSVVTIIDNSKEVISEFTDETLSEQAQTTLPLLASLMALFAPIAGLLSSALGALQMFGGGLSGNVFIQLLQAVGLFPAGKPQGMVYDSKTYEGVAFALITISSIDDQNEESLKETIVTDHSGVYQGVKLPPGRYRFSINHQDYIFPSQKERANYLTTKDYYRGEIFTINKSKDKEFLMIPVDPHGESIKKSVSLRGRIDMAIKYIGQKVNSVSIIFFIISCLLVLAKPSVVNIIFFVTYLILMILKVKSKVIKPTITGVVTNEEGQLLQNAIVKLNEPQKGELASLVSTDATGRFEFMVKKGKYAITAIKDGFVLTQPAMSLREVEYTKEKKFVVLPMQKVESMVINNSST